MDNEVIEYLKRLIRRVEEHVPLTGWHFDKEWRVVFSGDGRFILDFHIRPDRVSPKRDKLGTIVDVDHEYDEWNVDLAELLAIAPARLKEAIRLIEEFKR